MMKHQLARVLSEVQGRRILVIGDLMLDEYLWGHIERISPEAPVPVLSLVRRESTLGGAGNVMKNLTSFGARVIALGVVGEDPVGDSILEELDHIGVDRTNVWREAGGRRSTRKSRLMSLEHGQQVFRFDEESPQWIGTQTENRLLASLNSHIAGADAILCSDYLKGVLTPRVLQTIFQLARHFRKPSVVGPKDSDPHKYRLANILVPNAKELARLAKVVPNGGEWISRAATEVIRSLEIDSLLVTRGGEGMSLFESGTEKIRRVDIPTVARSVYDVTGAGDTVVSVFTLAIASGADHETAARLANIAAGIVVGKRGTVSATPDGILDRIMREEEFVSVPVQTQTF